jgi:hypothetical protein
MCFHTFVPEETRIVPQVSGMKTIVEEYRCPKCGQTKTREELSEDDDQ